ncbi:MAG: hypothetical protein II900_05465 [Prevotella sp.]|nr:hypothetical protein [Prevotella sp.]
MTVFLVILAVILLLVVDALILAGKLDFLMGRSLKLEVYGSLPRLRVITALSMFLTAIPLILLLTCEPDSLTMKNANVLFGLVSSLLGVLGGIWVRKKGRANEMNPIFVSRMMRNEKYNVSRVSFLMAAWTLVAGFGYISVYFFCNNALFWKVYFAILLLVSVAFGILQFTWAKKS